MKSNLVQQLINDDYSPAVAFQYLSAKNYGEAISRCRSFLDEHPRCLSAKIILARAMYHSGRMEAAEDQFYRILKIDPDNIVALKYIGDIKFRDGDESTAMFYYQKIFRIESHGGGLVSPLELKKGEKTKVVLIKKGTGKRDEDTADVTDRLPFKTETMGDILLKQGHTRLAMAVFKELAEKTGNPELLKKVEKTKLALKAGKDKNV